MPKKGYKQTVGHIQALRESRYRAKREIYGQLAKKYLEGNATVHGLCLEHEQEHGWYPDERVLSKYIKKLRPIPYFDWAIIWNIE